nr:luminescent protein OeNL [synthetic construct]
MVFTLEDFVGDWRQTAGYNLDQVLEQGGVSSLFQNLGVSVTPIQRIVLSGLEGGSGGSVSVIKPEMKKVEDAVAHSTLEGVSVIKPEMKMRYYMDGSVNGHEFTIEGEGTGRPYEGHQEMTLRVTMAEGGPMPFAFDLVSHVFCYGHRVFTKYPEEIPDYFKQAFPEGLSWERSLEFEDGGSASVSAHISLRGNTFYHKSKFTGVNFPADGPIMQNQSVDWEPSTEKITASDGVLKGDVTMYLKLEGGGNHKCQMKTTYKAAKEILEMPGDHYIGHRLVRKTEGNITEQVEDAVAHSELENGLKIDIHVIIPYEGLSGDQMGQIEKIFKVVYPVDDHHFKVILHYGTLVIDGVTPNMIDYFGRPYEGIAVFDGKKITVTGTLWNGNKIIDERLINPDGSLLFRVTINGVTGWRLCERILA